MARTSPRIVLDHEDALAALATWWKAICLTPIWAFLLIMPLGAFIRAYMPAYREVGFVWIIGFGLIYFVLDMARRRIIIDDKNIQFGMTSAPLNELESVKVASYMAWFLPVYRPRSLHLKFKEGRTIEVMLSRLSDAHLEQLIEIINRRVGHCRVDPLVEDVIKGRRPMSVLRIENPDKFEAKYFSARLLEELPQTLRRTSHSWGRLVGPIGTLILAAPFWLAFNLQLYGVLRNYENVSANAGFYTTLVAFLKMVSYYTSMALTTGQTVSLAAATSPGTAVAFTILAAYLITHGVKQMFGANQLTIDHNEVSLDRFFNLFSFTEKSCQWKDVENVMLEQPKGTADPNQARINFLDKKGIAKMTIQMSALSPTDRERLSAALIKFCGESYVASNLTEALEPVQEKSYTELWLRSLSDTPSRKNLEPLAPGHLLENGRWEIESKLAVGGEGVAYLGRDMKGLSQGKIEPVVLKETLIPPFVDKEVQKRALERFEREARLLKELESKYVVGLRHYFIEDHRCYLVLDYVGGKNLRQYIAEHGPIVEETVVSLAKQMCEILAFLHGRGVIHRDFTPDNLILQEDGQLKLIDFNVAKESDQGKTGTIVGKHAYVPPEQFRGKPTEQSDIYAMGATLHFLLTGRDPEPISQSSPRRVNPEVSEAMDALVRRCTAPDANKRKKTVAEVAALCQQLAPETDRKTDRKTDQIADWETDSETHSETHPETGQETGPETHPETGPETHPETGPETGPETHPETDSETGQETGPETDSETDSETGPETDSETGQETNGKDDREAESAQPVILVTPPVEHSNTLKVKVKAKKKEKAS